MEVVTKNNHFVLQADTRELQRLFNYGQVTSNGMIYHYELAGPEGADFTLFPSKEHTPEDFTKACEELRTDHDVVNIFTGAYIGEYPIPKEPPVWTPEQRESGFRNIVARRAFAQVENIPLCDLFTASTVVQIMDALSPANKEKFLSMNALAMVDITWKLVEKMKHEHG